MLSISIVVRAPVVYFFTAIAMFVVPALTILLASLCDTVRILYHRLYNRITPFKSFHSLLRNGDGVGYEIARPAVPASLTGIKMRIASSTKYFYFIFIVNNNSIGSIDISSAYIAGFHLRSICICVTIFLFWVMYNMDMGAC